MTETNWGLIFLAIFIMFAGIFAVAGSSVGISCYDKNEKFKEQGQAGYYFMFSTLGMAIFTILSASIILIRYRTNIRSAL